MNPKPTAVAAYIYAGGFTLGMQEHLDVMAHLEDAKPYAKATMQHNLGLPVYPMPWPMHEIDEWRPDVIYANPPCCAFSSMGSAVTKGRGAWRGHPALQCTKNVISLLKHVSPRALAWESVVNSLAHGYEFIADLAHEVIEMGYQFTMIPHNAYHMGSIQHRERIIYACTRDELLLAEPDYTRTETVMDRLATVIDPGPEIYGDKWHAAYGHLIPLTNQGEKLRHAYMTHYAATAELNARGHKVGCPAMSGPARLHADRAAYVVCGFPFVHPFEHRMLHLNEMKVLADFPESYEFLCGVNGVVNEMARGVSPYVGRWLGESLAATVTQSEPIKEATINFIDLRKPPGEREDFAKFCKRRGVDGALFYPEWAPQSELPLVAQYDCTVCGDLVDENESPCHHCGATLIWDV